MKILRLILLHISKYRISTKYRLREGGSCYTGRNPYRDGITIAMAGMLEPPEIPITFVLKKHPTPPSLSDKLGSVPR